MSGNSPDLCRGNSLSLPTVSRADRRSNEGVEGVKPLCLVWPPPLNSSCEVPLEVKIRVHPNVASHGPDSSKGTHLLWEVTMCLGQQCLCPPWSKTAEKKVVVRNQVEMKRRCRIDAKRRSRSLFGVQFSQRNELPISRSK